MIELGDNLTEFDDFAHNWRRLTQAINDKLSREDVWLDKEKFTELYKELVTIHDKILVKLVQDIDAQSIPSLGLTEEGKLTTKIWSQIRKARDYVYKRAKELEKVIEIMKAWLRYLPEEGKPPKEEKPPKEDEEAKKRWEKFLDVKDKLKKGLDTAKDAGVLEEKLRDANDMLKSAETLEKKKGPVTDEYIERIDEIVKHVHRIIEEHEESKKKREEKRAEILNRIKELRETVKEVGLDKETKGKVEDVEKWLERAKPDEYEEIEKLLNRLTETIEKARPLNEELSKIVEKAKELKLPEAESGEKILKEGTLGQKKQIKEEIESAIEKEEEKKEEIKKAEVPEEIPKNIKSLHEDFTRNLGNDRSGTYYYMLQIQDKCFPKNVPGYRSLPKNKTRKLRDMQKAANFFIHIYNTIKPKILNEKTFYEFIILLTAAGRRRIIWISWFHNLPDSIDQIIKAKEDLEIERAENAREENVSKDLLKHYDYILNKLLGPETMKLLENLKTDYHRIITEAENLKMPK